MNKLSELNTFKVLVNVDLPFVMLNVPCYIEGEFIWSYLGRLAEANGIKNVHEFLRMIYRSNTNVYWRKFIDWTYELDRPCMANFMEIVGKEHWILSASLYPYLSIFFSQGAMANKIRSYVEEYSRNDSKLITRPNKNIETLKLCEECAKQDLENEYVYLHTIHQMPGLSVCPIHGCALKNYVGEKGFEISSIGFLSHNGKVELQLSGYESVAHNDFIDQKYAEFCRDLFDNPVTSTAEDTIRAIRNALEVRYQTSGRRKINECLMKDELISKDEEVCNLAKYLYKNKEINGLPVPATIRLLIFLFGNYDNFILNLAIPESLETSFMESLGKTTKLIGNYNEKLVILRCKECGIEYLSTPLAQILGMGCPNCNLMLSDKEIFYRMFSPFRLAGWEIDNFISMGQKSTFCNEKLGISPQRCTPLQFLFQDVVSKRLRIRNIDPESVIRKHKRSNVREMYKEQFDNLEKVIESNRGNLIFTRDISFVADPDKSAVYNRNLKNEYFQQLAVDGKLVCLASGVYHHVNEKHTVEESIVGKYFHRNDLYIGVPTNETLISYISTGHIPKDNLCFTLMSDSNVMGNTLQNLGFNIKLYRTELQIDKNNWSKVAAILTLKHMEYLKSLPKSKRCKFRSWCKSLGLTKDDLIEYHNTGNHKNFNVELIWLFIREGKIG